MASVESGARHGSAAGFRSFRIPSTLSGVLYLIMAAFVALAIAQHAHRRGRAKAAAVRWLTQYNYRPISVRTPWLGAPMFRIAWNRDSDNAFVFEAEVIDSSLGGTGKVFLRVWVTWLGDIHDDIEVVWDKMPDGSVDGAPQPLLNRLEDAQLSLLRRIAEGEKAFYAPRNLEAHGREFSELVEHVLALSRRGMVTCAAPGVDGRNTHQYVSVTDISLTDQGRRWCETRSQ